MRTAADIKHTNPVRRTASEPCMLCHIDVSLTFASATQLSQHFPTEGCAGGTEHVDVAIIGAGPGGLALALGLQTVAPALKVKVCCGTRVCFSTKVCLCHELALC